MIDKLIEYFHIKKEDIDTKRSSIHYKGKEHCFIICRNISYKTDGSYFAKWYWIENDDYLTKHHGYNELIEGNNIKIKFYWKGNILK